MNQMMMQQLLNQLDLEATPAPRVARQIAERERQMSQTIERLSAATGVDVEPVEVDVDERTQILLQAAEAVMAQNFPDWWWSVIAPEILDNPDLAVEYAGLSADEWHDTLRGWYSNLYENGNVETPVEEASVEDIGAVAAHYCQGVFGLSLRDFVQTVVTWNPQRAVESVLAGPSDEMMRQFEMIADDLE